MMSPESPSTEAPMDPPLNDDSPMESVEEDESQQPSSEERQTRWTKQNQTTINCNCVKNMDVSPFLAVAVASDRGIHVFIPRFLSPTPVINAVYRHILLPTPSKELRDLILTRPVYSFNQTALFNQLLTYVRVSWSPNSLHLAALTMDGQLLVHRIDLHKSTKDASSFVSISENLLLNPMRKELKPYRVINTLKEESTFAVVTHFSWVSNNNSMQIMFITALRTLYLCSITDGVDFNIDFKKVMDLSKTPSCIFCRRESGSILEICIGFVEGTIHVYSWTGDDSPNMEYCSGSPDLIPVYSISYDPEAQLLAACKSDSVIVFGKDKSYSLKTGAEYMIQSVRWLDGGRRLFWTCRTGDMGVVRVDGGELSVEWGERAEITSKHAKYIMGAQPGQSVHAIAASNNAALLWYVFDDGFVEKRFRRDFKLVLLSDPNHPLPECDFRLQSCDLWFNKLWFNSSSSFDCTQLARSFWPQKLQILQSLFHWKLEEASLGQCPECSTDYVIEDEVELGVKCEQNHIWKLCCFGHVIFKPRDHVICLLCRTIYCETHQTQSCVVCKMSLK